VGRGREVARPLLEGEQLGRAAGGGGVMAEQPEEEDEGWGPRVIEGEEGGRPGGSADRWADAGRGEVEVGQGEEGEERPARLARPKAKWAGKASRAESEK
jgi:hypothetical protein